MSKTINDVMDELLDAVSAAVQRCEPQSAESFARAYATLEATSVPQTSSAALTPAKTGG